MKKRISSRLQARRARLGFARALETADPSMRAELIAIAARQDITR